MASGKGASLPKFGGWDEQDPSSGDGFTVIFNNARDERKTGGARIPQQPEAPAKTQLGDKPQTAKPSKFSLWGCCFRSSDAS